MGGSSSPASRSKLLAWERNLLNPWSSSTAELQLGDFISSFCFSKKSWTSDPKAERLSRDSSSTSRATRRSGAKTHTNAALMRRRVEAGLATGNRVPCVRGGHWRAESCWDSSSSKLLKELLLSRSAREGAWRRSSAKQSPSSCGTSLSSAFSCCGAELWNGTHWMSNLTVEWTEIFYLGKQKRLDLCKYIEIQHWPEMPDSSKLKLVLFFCCCCRYTWYWRIWLQTHVCN